MNLILQAIKSLFRKLETRLAKAEKYCVQTDWNQNDPTSPDYVKNRPFYEDVKKVDISGTSYTIESFPLHNQAIPLALGQVWESKRHHEQGGWMEYNTFEVRQAEDGTCYLGSPDLYDENGAVIYLTTNELVVPRGMEGQGYDAFEFTCVSGTVGETVVKHIDPKYIKDMYYEEDNSAKLSILVSDFGHAPNWTPYKVGPLPTRVNFEEPFSLKVDGVLYTFERFANDGQINAIGLNQRRIGAPFGRGQITDASEYPFTLIVFREEERYAHIAFADGSQNHTVEIPNVKLKKLDAKYLPEYDAVIKESVVVNDDGDTAEAMLLSGSYDAVVGRIKANELPRILWVSEYEDAEIIGKLVTEKIIASFICNKADNTEVLRFEVNGYNWVMLPDGTLELA